MKIIIIGNGIAGITAARYIRKQSSEAEITVISAESDYFFSRTALMYVYMGHLKFEHTQPYEAFFWQKNRISLLKKEVICINSDTKRIFLAQNESLSYDKLILATGSRPNKYGWKGQDLAAVQGLYFKQDLENMEKYSQNLQHAVIAGGGLIGIEMAEMFHARHIPVTFLVRENSFWANILPFEESEMINRHIRSQKGIALRLGEELQEIIGDENGRVKAIITKKGENIPCQFVGLTAGVSPNIDLAKGTSIETAKGFLVNDYLETSVSDIYAIGDCAQLRNPAAHRSAIEAVWYTGKIMGLILAENILGKKTPYIQGIWFNSAKFFDIEYQIYGEVPNTLFPKDTHLYWEHKDGKKSIRIVYDAVTKIVKGFNLMGIRYRQEVCEKWIAEKKTIQEVISQLEKANFDPEFYRRYEHEIKALFWAK